jgi:hypothetical protein
MVDLDKLHPNVRKYIPSENPDYVTARRKEFRIRQVDGRFWQAYPARGGSSPKCLNTTFTSFKDCERTLVAYLISTENPIFKATYPEEYRSGSRKTK